MDYLVQIEEYGRVIYNRRHRGPNPNVALRRALEASKVEGPAEAYVANSERNIWTYAFKNRKAKNVHRRESTENPASLLSGNIRLSMAR